MGIHLVTDGARMLLISLMPRLMTSERCSVRESLLTVLTLQTLHLKEIEKENALNQDVMLSGSSLGHI